MLVFDWLGRRSSLEDSALLVSLVRSTDLEDCFSCGPIGSKGFTHIHTNRFGHTHTSWK